MLLDRILFIAFAADRRLIDDQRILEKTAELRVPLRTAWNNFQSLFRALDVGDPRSGIPQFNGSMFAPDPVLDAPRFALGDQWATVFRTIGGYDFRSEVSVEVLGRVFERSIQDLEKLKQQGVPGPAPKDPPRKRPGRRKREGVFYTARPIVEYLVQSALEPPWTEVRQRAVERHRIARRDASPLAGGEQRPKTDRVKGQSRVVLSEARGRPTDEQSVHAITSVPSATCARELLDWLDSRTVCDPACGSGAFLIAAYDWFEERRMALLEDLASVEPEAPECSGGRETWRAATARQILRRNLYGVDLAPESVEIARLSLWIRSAIRNQTLTDLTHNIVQGNSVISDPAVDPRAFDWQVQFSEVFADGGFDAVIGNPPYVRQELLGSIKPRLQQEFPSVYNGLADLYVYFYDRGLQILKPGGMLAYVTTNKWMKAGYGEALRRTLARMHDLRRIVDFGHAKQFFPDADVFPCFAVVQKGVEEGDGEALIEDTLEPERSRLLDARNQAEAIDVGIIPRDLVRLDDLPAQIARSSFHIHRARLGSDAWSLERQEVHELLEKIRRSGAPLLEVTGAKPTRGILTGLNEAFLIDTTTRDRLVGKDSKCAPLIQAYLRGQDICRWLPDWAGLWMIALKSSGDHPWPWADLGDQAEACFRHTYPSLHEHLKPFEADLKRRQDQGRHWWELRACAYWELFTRPKIVYQEIQYHPAYAYDEESNLCNNKVFFLCTDYLVLLGILNSPAVWWHNWRYLPHMKDEALTPVAFLLESLLVPKLKRRFERLCGDICRHLLICSRDRRTTIRIVLDWLRTQHDVQKPSTRLQAATNLSSDEFVSEVKRSRGRERSMSAAALKDLRDEYARTIEPAKNLMAEALQLEYQLHDLVNEAYGLTPNEVKLMWDTAPPRMPIPRPPHV
jgi:hypothetical protein